jgi:hypothetical protein
MQNSLHLNLKSWYAQEGDILESRLDGFVIDIVRGEVLIEIQTRNFFAIKNKIINLVEKHPVRLVYPVALEKWIIRLPEEGDLPISRRRSPKRGKVIDVFKELIRMPHIIGHPNFSLEILLITEEEYLRNDGQGSWRRKGWTIVDRQLISVNSSQLFSQAEDFRTLIPFPPEQPFTRKELSNALGVPINLAGKMGYCLNKMEIITKAGKKGRSDLYTQCEIKA